MMKWVTLIYMLVFYDGRLETSDCCDGYVVAAAIDLACSLGANLALKLTKREVVVKLFTSFIFYRRRCYADFVMTGFRKSYSC